MTAMLTTEEPELKTPETEPARQPFTWEYSGPMLSDPIWRRLFALFWIGVYAVLGILWLFILFVAGPEAALDIFQTLAVGMAIFGLFIWGLTVLIQRNAWKATFTLDEQGAWMVTGTAAQRDLARGVQTVGAILGNAQVAGSAMAAEAASRQFVAWRNIHAAAFDDQHAIVTLWGVWRPMLYLWCPRDRYAEIATRIKAGVALGVCDRFLRPGELPKARRLRRLVNVLWTVAVVGAVLAVLWWDESQEDIAEFALTLAAFVWLAGLFPGWAGRGLAILTALASLALFAGVLDYYGDPFNEMITLAGCLSFFGLSVLRLIRQYPLFLPAPDLSPESS